MNKVEITPEFLADIKAKAEKATPGPWDVRSETGAWMIQTAAGEDESIRGRGVAAAFERPDAAYIAAANPQVMLSLIAMLEQLKGMYGVSIKERDALAEEIEELEQGEASLEEEADWLSLVLANHCCGLPLSEYIDMEINGMSPPAPEHWREAARTATEEQCQTK